MDITKIHILTTLREGPFGGGNQFLKGLKKYFKNKNVYNENPKDSDIILFNSYPFNEEFRFKEAYKLKKQNKVIIHRINGPIFKIRNKDLLIDKIIYCFNQILVDGTIFQSNWCKSENHKLGLKKNKNEIVIYNAADSKIFNKDKKIPFNRERKIKFIATSWSQNWRKGFDIYQYLDKNLDFSKYEMTFIGNSPIKLKNIKWIKPLNSKDLANQLGQHDIFITASQTDPCSNSLIEALHCGLPAIGLSDGGHPEIIGKNGLLFNNRNDIVDKIEELVKNYDYYQKNIDLSNIDFNNVGASYYNFCEKIYEECEQNAYFPKQPNYFKFMKLKFLLFKWKIVHFGFINLFKRSIKQKIKKILMIQQPCFSM